MKKNQPIKKHRKLRKWYYYAKVDAFSEVDMELFHTLCEINPNEEDYQAYEYPGGKMEYGFSKKLLRDLMKYEVLHDN